MRHLRFGLKIWLTEFAKCCTKDETEVSDFMKVKAVTYKMQSGTFCHSENPIMRKLTRLQFVCDSLFDITGVMVV